jgi:hypothetical protein
VCECDQAHKLQGIWQVANCVLVEEQPWTYQNLLEVSKN